MAVDFELARCKCGAVLFDGLAVRGLLRLRCPGCGRRAWVQGDGHSLEVIRVDVRPKKVPHAAA